MYVTRSNKPHTRDRMCRSAGWRELTSGGGEEVNAHGSSRDQSASTPRQCDVRTRVRLAVVGRVFYR